MWSNWVKKHCAHKDNNGQRAERAYQAYDIEYLYFPKKKKKSERERLRLTYSASVFHKLSVYLHISKYEHRETFSTVWPSSSF